MAARFQDAECLRQIIFEAQRRRHVLNTTAGGFSESRASQNLEVTMRFFISLFFVMVPTLTATSMALACDPITLLTVTIESSDAPECLQVTGLEEGDAAQIQVDNDCDVEVTISPLECDDVCSEEETFAPNTGGVMDVRESIGWSTADASGVITTSISEEASG